jgi:SAM-dependent methyltransferase
MTQGRMFELPPPTERFAVILPSPKDVSVVITEHEAIDNEAVVYLKGECSFEDFLYTRGWKNVACYLKDSPELWQEADRMHLIEEGADETTLRRRYLFKPCPLLELLISKIEETVASEHFSEGGDTSLRMRFLEPGCGSGRNLAWMASRKTKVNNLTLNWEVVGLDSWWGALERCQDLARSSGYPLSDFKLIHCQVDSLSGEFYPSSNKRSRAAESSHILNGIEELGTFDVILFSRFLHRPLHHRIPGLLNSGGYVLYNSFLNMPGVKQFGRPCGHEHLLDVGELAREFGQDRGFEVVSDKFEIEPLDGREMSMFAARKISP